MIVSSFGDSHIKNQYRSLVFAHEQNKEKEYSRSFLHSLMSRMKL